MATNLNDQPEFTDDEHAAFLKQQEEKFTVVNAWEVVVFLASFFSMTAVGVLLVFSFDRAAAVVAAVSFAWFFLFAFMLFHRLISYIGGIKWVFSLLISQNRVIVGLFRAANHTGNRSSPL